MRGAAANQEGGNGMLVTLEEMKNYLRVDDDEDDGLITTLLASAERMCMDILRTDEGKRPAGGRKWETGGDVYRGLSV